MDWIWEIAKDGDLVTEGLVGAIARCMTVQAYEDRCAAKQIAGEWIIYLPRLGLNYYLCLGTHSTGDVRLNDKICTLCALDFREIGVWRDEAAKAP